jgi:lysophospholipase L1-like esterase
VSFLPLLSDDSLNEFIPSLNSFADITGLRLNLSGLDYNAETGAWTDQSSFGANYQDNAATEIPTFTAAALNSRPAVTFNGTDKMLEGGTTAKTLLKGLSGYTSITLLRLNTISANRVAQSVLGNNTNRIMAVSTTSDNRMRLSARRQYGGASVNLDGPASMQMAGDWYIHVNRVDHTNTNGYLFRNGVLVAQNESLLDAGSIDNSNHSGTAFGNNWSNSTEWLDGDIAHHLIYDSALTDEQILQIMGRLKAIYNINTYHDQVERLIILHGDSIIQSNNLSNQSDRLAHQVWESLGSKHTDYVHNLGRSGATIDQLTTDAPNFLDIVPQRSGMETILVVGAGTNNASLGQLSSVLTMQLGTYLTARATNRSDMSVIVCTPIARSSAANTTVLSEYRDDILDGTGLTYDAVADLWSIVHDGGTPFDTAADANDTTYYLGDALHPNAFGVRLIANKIAETVRSV